MAGIYTAVATSTGEGRRGGRATSDDGALDVTLAVPAAMGGAGGGTNPEQLFAAGWAACFHSALKGVAAERRITVSDSAVVAEVTLQRAEGAAGYGLGAALHVEIGGVDQATAESLVEQAHQVCPYSNATRGNVEVALDVTVA
ncbi:Ohr family peroxiredoxin [Cellulomonas marina]|uniref:Peroxiredoxin, Ohr subfamily n=1 Tax=Cellulomonas marina TaxID=988821 RepID=A0A1I0WUR4_9CELL|nr:Ohr family peroxiredoxin [Cellulomonas marina]GIG30352.1 osmotically inducible protein C [Cellulomonas marina]SFA92294.1 peroxiredoxin, Ohr subfamily [Cellulomonas marina]